LKISIITAVLNNRACIGSCLESVRSQTHPDIEHIIVDGGSTDGTLEIIKAGNLSRETRLISEPDRGIYDALNKGILSATGDIIGVLHADDVYADGGVLQKVAEVMSKRDCDSCYGDLVYVKKTGKKTGNRSEVIGDGNKEEDKDETTGNRSEVIGYRKKENDEKEKTGDGNFKIVRYWRAGAYDRARFRKGWMPPHPTFFVKRELYGRLGGFDMGFRISADYELMLRFLWQNGISACYIPEVLVRMRTGGVSNRGVGNIILKSSEDYRAMRMHGVGGIATLVGKNISKIPQFF
jgi:glycosyltransferase involved in cell wall biosynthesis